MSCTYVRLYGSGLFNFQSMCVSTILTFAYFLGFDIPTGFIFIENVFLLFLFPFCFFSEYWQFVIIICRLQKYCFKLYVYIHIYIYIIICNIYVIYIPWLRNVYGEYTTRAPRYQPEAKPRADIEGRGLYIRHIHREAMVYIIYSIA